KSVGKAEMGHTGKRLLVIASALQESRRRWARKLEGVFAICEGAERRALDDVMANLWPGVLVVGLSLPQRRRVRGLFHSQRLSPSTKVLVLTDVPAEQEGIAALKAGAKGYCSRVIDPAHLKKAVQGVQNGEIWVPRKLISCLISEMISLTERRD